MRLERVMTKKMKLFTRQRKPLLGQKKLQTGQVIPRLSRESNRLSRRSPRLDGGSLTLDEGAPAWAETTPDWTEWTPACADEAPDRAEELTLDKRTPCLGGGNPSWKSIFPVYFHTCAAWGLLRGNCIRVSFTRSSWLLFWGVNRAVKHWAHNLSVLQPGHRPFQRVLHLSDGWCCVSHT